MYSVPKPLSYAVLNSGDRRNASSNDAAVVWGSSRRSRMQRSRSIVRVARACSGHSTIPWWFVAAGTLRKNGSRSGER